MNLTLQFPTWKRDYWGNEFPNDEWQEKKGTTLREQRERIQSKQFGFIAEDNSFYVCTHESSRGRSFHSDGMTFCTLRLCGWDPTLGNALDFHPFPVKIPHTFQNPETDQLPAPSCQMLSYSCCYWKALAPTSKSGLFPEGSMQILLLPFVSKQRLYFSLSVYVSLLCVNQFYSNHLPVLYNVASAMHWAVLCHCPDPTGEENCCSLLCSQSFTEMQANYPIFYFSPDFNGGGTFTARCSSSNCWNAYIVFCNLSLLCSWFCFHPSSIDSFLKCISQSCRHLKKCD